MLEISEDQFSVIRRGETRSFSRRVAEFLRARYPGARESGITRLIEEVSPLVDKAVAYGLDTERDAAAYVVTAVYLGRNFDQSLPSARAILIRPEVPGFVKARELSELTEAVLTRLSGDV